MQTILGHFWGILWLSCFRNVLALNISLNIFTREVLSGTDVLLSCVYHLDPNDTIYSLKWYKGTHEFYRHLPREKPSTTIFPWTDFPIESDGMEVGKVILRRVNAEAEGTYKCEASTEGPKFNTDSAEANLTVIELASGDPTIVTKMPSTTALKIGDKIRLNCSYGRSRPPAQMKWTINKELVHDSLLYVQRDDPKSVHSILDVALTARHFKNQRLDATCTAAVGNHFKRKVEVQIPLHKINQAVPAVVESQPAMAKIAGSLTTTAAGSRCNRMKWVDWKLLLIYLIRHIF